MSGKEPLPHRSPSPFIEPDHLLVERDMTPRENGPMDLTNPGTIILVAAG
jgi:hypothetical protein